MFLQDPSPSSCQTSSINECVNDLKLGSNRIVAVGFINSISQSDHNVGKGLLINTLLNEEAFPVSIEGVGELVDWLVGWLVGCGRLLFSVHQLIFTR